MVYGGIALICAASGLLQLLNTKILRSHGAAAQRKIIGCIEGTGRGSYLALCLAWK